MYCEPGLSHPWKFCYFISIVLLLSVQVTVKSDFLFHVYFDEYENMDNRKEDGECCLDNPHPQPLPCLHCIPTFTLCLRPARFPDDSEGCPLGNYTTPDAVRDTNSDDRVLLDQTEWSASGAPNPVLLNGTVWTVSYTIL